MHRPQTGQAILLLLAIGFSFCQRPAGQIAFREIAAYKSALSVYDEDYNYLAGIHTCTDSKGEHFIYYLKNQTLFFYYPERDSLSQLTLAPAFSGRTDLDLQSVFFRSPDSLFVVTSHKLFLVDPGKGIFDSIVPGIPGLSFFKSPGLDFYLKGDVLLLPCTIGQSSRQPDYFGYKDAFHLSYHLPSRKSIGCTRVMPASVYHRNYYGCALMTTASGSGIVYSPELCDTVYSILPGESMQANPMKNERFDLTKTPVFDTALFMNLPAVQRYLHNRGWIYTYLFHLPEPKLYVRGSLRNMNFDEQRVTISDEHFNIRAQVTKTKYTPFKGEIIGPWKNGFMACVADTVTGQLNFLHYDIDL